VRTQTEVFNQINQAKVETLRSTFFSALAIAALMKKFNLAVPDVSFKRI
jgi:hypothetical protein